MNKKLNTLFFIIGATVFNLLIMLVLMLISLTLVGVIFRGNLNPNILSVLMMVIFLSSIIGSFVIYSWLVKRIAKKIDMDKYFLPLFKKRKN